MYSRNVIWLPVVKDKLTKFRSARFTSEETIDFISQFILETEDLLKDSTLSKAYTEEFGQYKGISRVVIKRFRVYFRQVGNDVVILAILFPGES